MLAALGVFCLACTGTVFFARWLVFDSPVGMDVELQVGRGTVSLAEPDATDEKAVRGTAPVGNNDRISTDGDSQGYMAFYDPYSGKIIATATLHGNSLVTLDRANRPRFGLSDNDYSIKLKAVSGTLDLWVRDDMDRGVDIWVEAPLGSTHITESGYFYLTSTPDDLRLYAEQGRATLINREGQAHLISAGATGTLNVETAGVELGPTPVTLVLDGGFDESKEWPVGWSCTPLSSESSPDAPSADYGFTETDGRSSIFIRRMQPDPGHGQSGCIQYLADPVAGLDVNEYESVHWRVTMKIHHQSLSACGLEGSECPVMLHMLYRDADGNEYEWHHGFYVELRPNEGRTRCSSCLEEHEQIHKDAWYTYESGNLFTDLPEDRRPSSIVYIEFYSSGHQYDIVLDEVTLIATPKNAGESVAAR